jgi:ribosome recycling factor
MVDSYGEKQPLNAVAQIALKNPTLIVVNPFDGAVRDSVDARALSQH